LGYLTFATSHKPSPTKHQNKRSKNRANFFFSRRSRTRRTGRAAKRYVGARPYPTPLAKPKRPRTSRKTKVIKKKVSYLSFLFLNQK